MLQKIIYGPSYLIPKYNKPLPTSIHDPNTRSHANPEIPVLAHVRIEHTPPPLDIRRSVYKSGLVMKKKKALFYEVTVQFW